MLIHVKDVTIKVGNKKNGDVGVYIGRPSPLGSPFDVKIAGRDAAIKAYREWFHDKIKCHDKKVCGELDRLLKLAKRNKQLTLVCWCKPARCHGDVIAEELAKVLSQGATFAGAAGSEPPPAKVARRPGSYAFLAKDNTAMKARIQQIAAMKKAVKEQT